MLDFGVSMGQTGDGTRLPLTSPGAILGTPKYMAPEQALGTVATASADLFAMGAILYEMLSGAAAFEAESVHGILEKVLHGDVPTLAGPPAVAAADRVIHRALAKSPAERYVSAAAMAEDLRTALVAVGSEGDRGARPVTRLMVLPFRLLRPDTEIDFLAFSLGRCRHELAFAPRIARRSLDACCRPVRVERAGSANDRRRGQSGRRAERHVAPGRGRCFV